jgi:O-antigen/teichoic acid export membrane protein
MLKSLLPLVALIPVAANSISLYHVLYVSIGKAKVIAVLSLCTTTIKIPFVYLAVYVFKNLIWIFVTIFALELIQIAFFIVFLARKGIRVNPFNFSSAKVKKILAYALPMGVYALTATLTRELAKLVVGRLAGTEQLAIYTNCSKILPFDFLVTSFAVVLIPYIVKYVSACDKEKSEALFSQYLKVGYYSVWILATMVLIAPETTISFLYSDEYIVGKEIFIIYIFDSMLRFASMHLILTSANKANNVMMYSLLALGLNLVLNIAFYYAFGLVGPAIATVISAVVYTYLILNKSIKIIDTRWRDVFNIKEISWLIFTLACLWGAMFGLNILLVNIGLHRYLSMILCMAIFGFSALGIHFKKISAILKNINSFRM